MMAFAPLEKAPGKMVSTRSRVGLAASARRPPGSDGLSCAGWEARTGGGALSPVDDDEVWELRRVDRLAVNACSWLRHRPSRRPAAVPPPCSADSDVWSSTHAAVDDADRSVGAWAGDGIQMRPERHEPIWSVVLPARCGDDGDNALTAHPQSPASGSVGHLILIVAWSELSHVDPRAQWPEA